MSNGSAVSGRAGSGPGLSRLGGGMARQKQRGRGREDDELGAWGHAPERGAIAGRGIDTIWTDDDV